MCVLKYFFDALLNMFDLCNEKPLNGLKKKIHVYNRLYANSTNKIICLIVKY